MGSQRHVAATVLGEPSLPVVVVRHRSLDAAADPAPGMGRVPPDEDRPPIIDILPPKPPTAVLELQRGILLIDQPEAIGATQVWKPLAVDELFGQRGVKVLTQCSTRRRIFLVRWSGRWRFSWMNAHWLCLNDSEDPRVRWEKENSATS